MTARLYSPGRLIGSFIATSIVLGLGWALVYEYAIKVLMREGHLKLQRLLEFDLVSTLWWRDFIALAFDLLIIIVAAIGTWWVVAHFVLEAREAGKWRLYYNSPEGRRDTWVPRLTAWQRVQHLWLMITFIVCAVTGMAAHLDVLADRATLLTIHVYSGIAMGILAIIHVVYYGVQALVAKARGESLREKFPMLEIYSIRYVKNLVKALIHPFYPRVKPEPYGKYDPEQIFEYWGVYWGMAVLGIPGVLLALYGPSILDGILWVMHWKEAILAITFILMVHMGYTHLRPSIFPIDTTFIHGKMPMKRVKEEHPRWAQELAGEAQEQTSG
ncbi:hypothetical protein Pyrfu_1205 [Pyrolobus fumarii 1A]|uniref:Cytochrome b561 bacterial/Ni-hydrogenase domain-containing protein n=1 Tax=Pyrolobus fumarii (strain DSM 11204 / 1A) TaxID=694429 RepID=G0EFW6_PYRF1|nr:hypothetical protein [Pyrolobus fumarii]AEM39067.1 hypothetical protein Pyrfu_1205 [Pyrolobus fumarii 1A]